MKTDLSIYDNSFYSPGRGAIVRLVWYYTNLLFFHSALFPGSGWKCRILRLFGARVGRGVIIKPSVNIKYTWRLTIGDHTWIGEGAWIDNLDEVTIGSHCCLSQGAMLLCGNHNFKKPAFDLITGKITLEDGAWVGAQSVVCPGVTCRSHAILTVNSVATRDLEPYSIYQGNPAVKVKERNIETTSPS